MHNGVHNKRRKKMFGSKNKQEAEPDSQYFTVYDTKGGFYRDPIMHPNRHTMLRHLSMFYRNQENRLDQLFTNSEDFQLFKIGDYYKKTGTLVGHEPEHVANLHEVKHAALLAAKQDMGIAST